MKVGNKTRYPILLANLKDRSHASLTYLLALRDCRPKKIVKMTFLTLAVRPERIKALYGLLTGCQSLLQPLPVHHLSVISLVWNLLRLFHSESSDTALYHEGGGGGGQAYAYAVIDLKTVLWTAKIFDCLHVHWRSIEENKSLIWPNDRN